MLIAHAAEQILAEAVQAELRVSHLYKHVSNQCQRAGLFGAAKFFKNESKEELEHYEKLANYLNDRGSVATLPSIESFEEPIRALDSALQLAYNEEVALGNRYSKWYSTLLASDPTTAQFLLQFLEIQRLSVGEYGDLLARARLAGDNEAAILILDKELEA
jgi:ferritin